MKWLWAQVSDMNLEVKRLLGHCYAFTDTVKLCYLPFPTSRDFGGLAFLSFLKMQYEKDS